MPDGFKLKKKSETKFSTYYQVAERFVKSAGRVSYTLEILTSTPAKIAYGRLKKLSNIDGSTIEYPGIEKIFDSFGIVVDFIELFESTQRKLLKSLTM